MITSGIYNYVNILDKAAYSFPTTLWQGKGTLFLSH